MWVYVGVDGTICLTNSNIIRTFYIDFLNLLVCETVHFIEKLILQMVDALPTTNFPNVELKWNLFSPPVS